MRPLYLQIITYNYNSNMNTHPKAVTAEEMSRIDRKAQEEYGIPQTVLMENAGRLVFDVIISDHPDIVSEKIVIFCGKGNNGGDGFVAARLLSSLSPDNVIVYSMDPEKMKSGAARQNFILAKEAEIDIRPTDTFLEACPEGVTIFIDAVFGTGFKGALPEKYASIFRKVNESSAGRYAVDIPSGLDSTTGKAGKNSFKAHKTVSFGLPKKGFYIASGPDLCGEIVVENIGFPEELLAEYR